MLFKRVLIISLGLLGFLILGSLYYMSPKISLSLMVGGVIGLANFFLLGRAVSGLLGGTGAGKGRLVALFFFKLLALAAIFAILLMAPINTLAFVAGLGAVMVAITVAGLIPHGRTF